jgi:hypothetical protein
LAEPFQGGGGPSHSTVALVFGIGDASDYLPEDGNKLDKVLTGLRHLQNGRQQTAAVAALPADHEKLHAVAAELAVRLMATNAIDADRLSEAFAADGLTLEGNQLAPARPADEPADRIAAHVGELFGGNAGFDVARNHFEQAGRAFDRGDYEAANSQYRAAFDAAYDVLAHGKGCPIERTGGQARRWLADNGFLEEDESELLKTFFAFAGRAGSHAGLSDAADSQLRRHFATALIAFGIGKLG